MPPGDARRALIQRAAALVVDAFDDYNARFSDITRRARRRFRQRDWEGHRRDARARIGLYDRCIAETIGRLESLLAERLLSRTLWLDIHADYADAISGRLDAELYKTFFNTLTRRLFKTRGVDPGMEFVALDIEPTERITHPVARDIHSCYEEPAGALARLLSEPRLGCTAEHVAVDAERMADRLGAALADAGDDRLLSVEMLQVPFYRDRRAYLVGRAFGRSRWLPCVIALVHGDDGIRADAVITERHQVSRLFGFTYSYFHADLPTVGDAIVFLRMLLPDKPIDELYTVLGRAKQGKTERYRHFFKHLDRSGEEGLVEAEGKRGMVMVVFTLPSYPLVFKIVRDHFARGKKIGREHVLSQYRLVFNHDRVGRLIDAQEYRHLAFDRRRFDPALLEQLLSECARSVQVDGDRVLVRHCFVQRRVRPLDLYLGEHDAAERERMVRDYGQAIKDLAHSNLFPGDLFVKNFGVTRSRRCVFYDYDEVSLVTDLNFRRVPEPRTEEQAMADEPWYPVERGDTFPEHFARFIDLSPELRECFAAAHAELFDPQWWRGQQARLKNDPAGDVQPYPDAARLASDEA
ncbi:MAG: bifunctional isocitrate dehydrogenase kinase/phosphatase [Candidatus Wenzhouxiangella sp. M2_3B_020]